MSNGQTRVPVMQGVWHSAQEASHPRRPEMLLSSALLPAAHWVCRQIVCCQPNTTPASRAAREFTAQILRGWGLSVLSEDAAVVVTELVTNALRHGSGGMTDAAHDCVELILWRRPGDVVCAVTDRGAEIPVLAQPDPLAEAGRGLHVVQALSATWGWARLGDRRKAVWAVLAASCPAAGQEKLGGPA
jgi:anti-sigma regulatory factor (Ser/Thr protein kinase)